MVPSVERLPSREEVLCSVFCPEEAGCVMHANKSNPLKVEAGTSAVQGQSSTAQYVKAIRRYSRPWVETKIIGPRLFILSFERLATRKLLILLLLFWFLGFFGAFVFVCLFFSKSIFGVYICLYPKGHNFFSQE